MSETLSSLSCPICFSTYNCTTHEPRIVPLCGHSICLSCLEKIMTDDEYIFRCPVCLRRIKFQKVEAACFPKNYSMMELVEKFKHHEFCNVHHSQMDLVCITCKVKVCGKCVFRGEHKTHEVDVIEDYLRETHAKADDTEEWINSFESYYMTAEKVLMTQERKLLGLIDEKFEQYIKSVLQRKSATTEEVRAYFTSLRLGTPAQIFSEMDVESRRNIFDWKQQFKNKIGSWKARNSLADAFDINVQDRSIVKEIKEWLGSEHVRFFHEKMREVPSGVLPIFEQMKFLDDKIIENLEDHIKIENSNSDLLIVEKNESSEQIEINISEQTKSGELISKFINLNEDTVDKNYINHLVKSLWTGSVIKSFDLKTNKTCISEESMTTILSGLTCMYDLNNLSLDMGELSVLTDQRINQLSQTIQMFSNLENLKLNFRTCSNISDATIIRLTKSISGLKNLSKLSLSFKSCEKLTDQSLSALAKNLCYMTQLREIGISFSGSLALTNTGVSHLIVAFEHLKDLTKLELSFNHCGLSDEGINQLVMGFHDLHYLKKLALSFKGCSDLSNKGLNQFSENLSKLTTIEELSLDFEGCRKISDNGFGLIAQSLNSFAQLERLTLNFDRCLLLTEISLVKLAGIIASQKSYKSVQVFLRENHIITDEGIKALGSSFKDLTNIIELSFGFTGLTKITSEGLLPLSESLSTLSNLSKLELDLEGCCGINEEGSGHIIEALATAKNLENLTLNLKGCFNIGNSCLKQIGKHISSFTNLKSFTLGLEGCVKITDGGLSQLSIYLPALQELTYLSLKFGGCGKISDEGAIQLSNTLTSISNLKSLQLDFKDCSSISKQGISQISTAFNSFSTTAVKLFY